jgi:predicted Na+-dependent transporter
MLTILIMMAIHAMKNSLSIDTKAIIKNIINMIAVIIMAGTRDLTACTKNVMAGTGNPIMVTTIMAIDFSMMTDGN